MWSEHVTNTYKPKSSHGTRNIPTKGEDRFLSELCVNCSIVGWEGDVYLGVRVLTVQIMIITRAASVQASAVQCSIGSTTGCTITEKAPTRAFSVITNLRICFGWNFLKHSGLMIRTGLRIRMLPSGGDNPALVLGDLLTVRSFSLLNNVIIVMFYSRWA